MPAPQATLMTTVINGILNRNLQWGLVLFGVFMVIVLELCGVRSLAFAVGSYLPISTTAPIFAGGVVRWLVERGTGASKAGEGEVSSGSLTASGLIAGGAIAGLLLVGPMDAKRTAAAAAAQRAGERLAPEQIPFDLGNRWWPELSDSNVAALLVFVALAAFLYWLARKRLETGEA
jgi:hypothetical protein